MTTKVMGAAIKRKEDPRLITGEAKYLDDVQLLSFDLHKTLKLVLYRRVYKTQSIISVHQSVLEQTSCQHQPVVFSTTSFCGFP